MSSLAQTLQQRKSGVLRSGRTAQEVAAVGRSAGWRVVDLELTEPTDKAGFLDLCARAFDLPDYFGHNWDALADCMEDIQDTPGVLVAFAGAQHLQPRDRDVVRDIFEERVEIGPTPFVVVAATGAE